MKDRIKMIMEAQHMTQQVFADFIGIAPATLSGIFNDRTRPTINIVEAIKKKLPAINTDWLMFGLGSMYVSDSSSSASVDSNGSTVDVTNSSVSSVPSQKTLFDFNTPSGVPSSAAPYTPTVQKTVRNQRIDIDIDTMKNIDKNIRKVTEIRVFYDDQTWESFVPAKK